MERDHKQLEASGQTAFERLAEALRKASPEEFSEIEKRFFNETSQPSHLSLMWLHAFRRMRAGMPPKEALEQFLVSQAELLYREIHAPWESTPFEAPLKRIKLDPGRAALVMEPVNPNPDYSPVFPATEAGHLQFWNSIYARVQDAAQSFKGKPPGLVPSKEAAIYLRAARQLQKLIGKVEPFMSRRPLLQGVVNKWRLQSKDLDILADEVQDPLKSMSLALQAEDPELHAEFERQRERNKAKRHAQEPHTREILNLMDLIHQETGRWHDRELSELLNLAGLNQITPKSLADYRRHSK